MILFTMEIAIKLYQPVPSIVKFVKHLSSIHSVQVLTSHRPNFL